MAITKRAFGKMDDGRQVDIYCLSNQGGTKIEITDFGGIIVSIAVPDKNGEFNDIALGFENLDDYLHRNEYFGAIIGRYANRIKDGTFRLNSDRYYLAKNDGPNHLHGGQIGFDKVLWDANIIEGDGLESLSLNYLSCDGEENYPGNLDIKVTYSLTKDNELIIDYWAIADKETIVNLTNHSYLIFRDMKAEIFAGIGSGLMPIDLPPLMKIIYLRVRLPM